jgi:hypothetical protein
MEGINPYSYFKKKVRYVPVEDGFITSDGKKKEESFVITIKPSISFYKGSVGTAPFGAYIRRPT